MCVYYIYLPPCKTILLRILNIVRDSRPDSSFILVSLCVLSWLHTRSFPPAQNLSPSTHIVLTRSIYIFLTVSLYIIAPAPHIIIITLYICNPLAFCRFPYPARFHVLMRRYIHASTYIYTSLQIRRLIYTHSRSTTRSFVTSTHKYSYPKPYN